jgi:heme A synthase
MFTNIDINKLFSVSYIFQNAPNPEGLYRYLAIFFGLEIVGALIIAAFGRQKSPTRKVKSSFFSLLLTTGIIGLSLIFFRFEEIPYLGSRLMLIILFLVLICWVAFIFWHWLIILPEEQREIREQQRFQKYLPHKTKKGSN